jgi:hypothetical protein
LRRFDNIIAATALTTFPGLSILARRWLAVVDGIRLKPDDHLDSHPNLCPGGYLRVGAGHLPFSRSSNHSYAAQLPDLNWEIRAVADLNCDYQPDLIWQNKATGYLAVWYFSGSTCIGTTYIWGPWESDLN